MVNHNVSNFYTCDKVLVKSCVHFYHECCKRRCIVLCNLEVQHKVSKEEVAVIIEGANKQHIEELSRNGQTHAINLNEASA